MLPAIHLQTQTQTQMGTRMRIRTQTQKQREKGEDIIHTNEIYYDENVSNSSNENCELYANLNINHYKYQTKKDSNSDTYQCLIQRQQKQQQGTLQQTEEKEKDDGYGSNGRSDSSDSSTVTIPTMQTHNTNMVTPPTTVLTTQQSGFTTNQTTHQTINQTINQTTICTPNNMEMKDESINVCQQSLEMMNDGCCTTVSAGTSLTSQPSQPSALAPPPLPPLIVNTAMQDYSLQAIQNGNKNGNENGIQNVYENTQNERNNNNNNNNNSNDRHGMDLYFLENHNKSNGWRVLPSLMLNPSASR